MTEVAPIGISVQVTLRGQDAGQHELREVAGAIGNDLPGRLAGTGSVTRRTATIRWRKNAAIFDPLNPFDPGAPHAGDPVVCTVTTTVRGQPTTRVVFTGKVDTRSSEALDLWETPLVDAWDDLAGKVRVEPLLRFMPGRRDTTDPTTSPGAAGAFQVWQVLAKAGYRHPIREMHPPYATSDVAFYIPLQGTMWSDWRANHGANRRAGGDLRTFNTTPGWVQDLDPVTQAISLTQGYGFYDKDNPPKVIMRGGFSIRLWVGPKHTANTWARIDLDGVNFITLQITADRKVSLRLNGKDLHAPRPIGDKGGVLVADIGAMDGTYALSMWDMENPDTPLWRDWRTAQWPGNWENYRLLSLDLNVEKGAEISHVLVLNDWATTNRPTGKRLAVVGLPGDTLQMQYVPSVRDATGQSVIEDLSTRLTTPVWYDADGLLHVEYAPYLRSRSPVKTIRVADLKSWTHKEDTLMTADTVRVEWESPTATRTKGGGQSVTLWQGTGGTLADGETMEEFVGPSDTEDWVEPDKTFIGSKVTVVSQDRQELAEINRQLGSVYMTEMEGQAPGGWSFRCEEVTPWRWKLTAKGMGAAVRLQIPEGGGNGLSTVVQGDATPIFRGGALITRESETAIEVKTTGKGPALTHDVGVWGHPSLAKSLANEVAKHAVDPLFFESMTVLLDLSIDVGRVLTIDGTVPWGRTFRVLVVEVRHSPVEGTTTFTPRIIPGTMTSAS